MKKHAFFAILTCVIVTIVAVGFIQQRGSKQQRAPGDGSESLRAMSAKAGRVTATAEPKNLRAYDDIATLTRDSGSVVVGTVESQASSLLQPDEKMIVTDYQVSVRTVLKGSIAPGQTITLREPGGRVQLENGKSAEVSLPAYWKNPEVGKTYVLFLSSRPAGHFVLSGGPQGMFELTPSGTISPQAGPEDKLTQSNNGKAQAMFIGEIRRVVVGGK
jgi:hypothetical protein